MNGTTQQLTVVRDIGRISNYPYTAIDAKVLLLLSNAGEAQTHQWAKARIQHALRLFECFLQITRQEFSVSTLNSVDFLPLAKDFLGALRSPRFWDASDKTRSTASRAFIEMCVAVREPYSAFWSNDDLKFVTESLGKTIIDDADHFETRQLDEEKVWMWRGWKIVDLKGNAQWLPMLRLYNRLGQTFTDRLFFECQIYCNARRHGVPLPFLELCRFIGDYSADISAARFLDRQFITIFWRDFLVHYFTHGYSNGDGSSVATLTTRWRGNFPAFVQQHLVATGIFAAPIGNFPMPKAKKVHGAKTNIRHDKHGQEVKTKLITHVPLEIKDEQALTAIFDRINTDVFTLTTWATHAASDLIARFERGQLLARCGKVRTIQEPSVNTGSKWETNRANPNYLANSAATLAHHGYLTRIETTVRLMFALPLSKTAFELGMPTTGALIPHCILLVSEHPSITPAFLEQLELYDRNGKLTGFIEADGGFRLSSWKRRRGSANAEQTILLNEKTAVIVQQIILITQSIRQYLRDRNNDDWRYLLLTCAQGFASPKRIRRLASETSISSRLDALSKSLTCYSTLSLIESRELLSRFNLPSLRASVGVLIYLKNQSVTEMSKALGHVRYSPALLERYLPGPIIEFFQERWIRIFQTGLIVQAMEKSVNLIQASGFADMDEIDEFLMNHSVKKNLFVTPKVDPIEERENTEVIFSVNREIVTLLNNLSIAVGKTARTVHPKARYWASIAENVIAYMRTRQLHRDDFRDYLEYATAHQDTEAMEKIIYESQFIPVG